MGNKQSATTSWSVDDWAFGTGANAVSMGEVVEEAGKIPRKYFGGAVVEKDPSMNHLQHDLLAFDESVKNIFRRKKNKRVRSDQPPPDESYYYEEEEEQQQSEEFPQAIDSEQIPYSVNSQSSARNQDYLPPIYTRNDQLPKLEPITSYIEYEKRDTGRAAWRCSSCTAENKITEHACRRCGQAETRL